MSQAAIKSAISAQFAALATATTPLDPNPATNADLVYGRLATALYNALQLGVTDGSSAGAGEIGQVIRSNFATPMTAGATGNVGSIALPPGDFDVTLFAFCPGGTAGNYFVCGISPTSGVRGAAGIEEGQAAPSATTGVTVSVPQYIANHNVSPTKTYYAVCTVSINATIYGQLIARRRR